MQVQGRGILGKARLVREARRSDGTLGGISEEEESTTQGVPSVERLAQEGNKRIPKTARPTGLQISFRCSSSSFRFPGIFPLLIFKSLLFYFPTLLREHFSSTRHNTYILILFKATSNLDMYHVSARPGHQHHEMYQHQHPAAPLPNLQLPRTLNRPPFTEVQREAILAVEPNLGQVPFEYIRKGLHARGDEYVQPDSNHLRTILN